MYKYNAHLTFSAPLTSHTQNSSRENIDQHRIWLLQNRKVALHDKNMNYQYLKAMASFSHMLLAYVVTAHRHFVIELCGCNLSVDTVSKCVGRAKTILISHPNGDVKADCLPMSS